jgi:hypothetical protein
LNVVTYTKCHQERKFFNHNFLSLRGVLGFTADVPESD